MGGGEGVRGGKEGGAEDGTTSETLHYKIIKRQQQQQHNKQMDFVHVQISLVKRC